jgi:hypothetical protein
MTEPVNISCASLVKCSAKQICFHRLNKKEQVVTEKMQEGQNYAKRNTISEFVEMRGTFKAAENIFLHYAVDEIRVEKKVATFVEHKYIEPRSKIERWYFDISVLQVALYSALATENKSRKYVTATFHPGPKHTLDLAKHDIVSFLDFGTNYFVVNVTDTKALVDFYVEKAKASLGYDTAGEFDAKYKFKEYAQLKKYIKFGGLQPVEEILENGR